MKDFNTDANTHETESSRYIVINGQRVPLTDDLQRLYNKEINDTRNRARREHSCANPDYRNCHGDCALCRYHVQGNILSTDDERYAAGFAVGENAPVNTVRTPEEIYCAKESVRDLYAAAARVVKNGDRMAMPSAPMIPPTRTATISMPRARISPSCSGWTAKRS